MNKKFIAFCLTAVMAMNFIFMSARAAECLLAQEPTQIGIALMIKEEISTLETILNDQDKMLKRWKTDSYEYKKMKEQRDTLINAVKNLRETMTSSGALTHMSKEIETRLKERHPAWRDNLTLDDVKKRQRDRETKWRDTVKAYLKSVNTTQSLNEDYRVLRVRLFDLLKKPNGEVQAIQSLAGFMDYAATMMALNEQAIQSFITAYAEYERDEMDERQDFSKTTMQVCTKLKAYNPTFKTCKLGF